MLACASSRGSRKQHWLCGTAAQVHPDQAVLYEALLAGLGQQRQYHLDEGRADQIYAKLNEIAAGPATTLRLVLDMMFPDQLGKQAASAIEQCVLVSR